LAPADEQAQTVAELALKFGAHGGR
jgi:hypothetical protein